MTKNEHSPKFKDNVQVEIKFSPKVNYEKQRVNHRFPFGLLTNYISPVPPLFLEIFLNFLKTI